MNRSGFGITGVLIWGLNISSVWGMCLEPSSCGFTYQQIDGNRFVPGYGSIPEIVPVQIPLPQPPIWLVAVPEDQGAIWVTVLDDGAVQGFRSQGAQVDPVSVEPSRLPVGHPPLLQRTTEGIFLLTIEDPLVSALTHGIPTQQGELWITTSGELRLGSQQISAQALPDARLIGDGSERWVILAGADDQRYRHDVLGDAIEATQLQMISTVLDLRSLLTIDLAPTEVIEGIAPIWADLDGQTGRELIVTLSNSETGGQIGVFNESGEELARGPGFSQGNRWRHPIAVAPLGPEGELELAVVRTPHIGGIVEFYQLQDQTLDIVARYPGFTSHQIGSRNLDMGLVGDLNGDDQPEVVLPRQDLNSLGGIQRTPEGIEVIWEVVLPTELTTNLTAIQTIDQQILFGAGLQDRLLLWLEPDQDLAR